MYFRGKQIFTETRGENGESDSKHVSSPTPFKGNVLLNYYSPLNYIVLHFFCCTSLCTTTVKNRTLPQAAINHVKSHVLTYSDHIKLNYRDISKRKAKEKKHSQWVKEI